MSIFERLNEKQLKYMMIASIVLFIATFVAYVTLTIKGIRANLNDFTSFPWYTAIIVNTGIYIVPLSVEVFFIIFFNKKRKNLRGEK